MDKLKILGISRGSRFSPNHILNDDAVFTLTATELSKNNCEVAICSEDEFMLREDPEADFIFTMARAKKVVARLQSLEAAGKYVINSGYGIENCFRTNMTKKLIENDIPYPKSCVIPTSQPDYNIFEKINGKGYWIKRGDFHAIHKEDVTFVESAEQGRNILREFALRDIPDAVVSEHLFGDLVKFYGVGEEFFHLFYPYDHNHLKYAENETINGKPLHFEFDQLALRAAAAKSANVLNISIYGGDAIIDKNGNFHIIDINDWPSFAPCREEAVRHIAAFILNYFKVAASR